MDFTAVFNDIYKEYYKKSLHFTLLYVRDEVVAEDIVVESLVKLWQTMKNEEVRNPSALLLTILKNKSLDYLKTFNRQKEILDSIHDWKQQEIQIRISTLEACNPEYVFSEEIRTLVQTTLDKLPEQTRKVFYMNRIEQKSIKEIASILGLSVKGVDYHMAKSLKALRIALKDYLPIYLIWLLP